MCQIVFFKSTEKVFFTVVALVTVMTVVRTIMQPLHKKILQLVIFVFSFFSLSTFGKQLDHLTTNVMFLGQRFAILTMFLFEVTLKLPLPQIIIFKRIRN